MVRLRNTWAAAVALLSAAALAGCGSSGVAGNGPLSGKNVTVVTCSTSNALCSKLAAVVSSALERQGAKVSVLTQDFNATQEVQLLNQAIASRPDLILLHETADAKAVIPVVKRAKQQGVPIVNIDGRAEDSAVPDLTSQVIHDNVQLGRFAAQNIVEGLQKEGKKTGNVIAITGTQSMLITQDRMKGFTEVMATHSEYKLVATEDGNWDAVKSGQIAQQLFAKFSGSVDAAYGMADYQAVPIVQAARQAGIPVGTTDKGIVVTGSNCTKAGVASVADGKMFGSATEDPTTLGEYTAETAASLLRGDKVAPTVWVPTQRITGSNVSQFMQRCSY